MASGFTKKEWKARVAEFATRRLLSIVSQSPSSMTVEVKRSEGLVSQEGDAFSPENMNGLEQRVYNAFTNVDKDIEEAKKSASDGKKLIAAAITAKRVAADASDTFAVLAQKIGRIILGSGNATRADVLAGKTFTNDDGIQYSGTMPNRETLNWSGVNTTAGVAAGYYSGGTLDSRPSYNKGVADADGRANPSSVNYQAGYNSGQASMKLVVHELPYTVPKSGKYAVTWHVVGVNVVDYDSVDGGVYYNLNCGQTRISNASIDLRNKRDHGSYDYSGVVEASNGDVISDVKTGSSRCVSFSQGWVTEVTN